MAVEMHGGTSDSLTLRGALLLAEAYGLRVVPAHFLNSSGGCSCGNAKCGSPAKHPIGDDWQARASSDPEAVRALWRAPRSNVGVVTGQSGGIVVIDIDGEVGEATLAALEREHGALPRCPIVITSRGRHLYFASAGSPPIPNRAGDRGRGLGKGIDIRGEGGFVIAPPSVHESGVTYGWALGCSPADVSPPALPQWLVARVIEPARGAPSGNVEPPSRSFVGTRVDKWAAAALTREVDAVRSASEGTRNNTLNTAAFNLGLIVHGGALDGGEAKRALRAAAVEAGLSEFEAVKTIMSAFAAASKAETRKGPERDLPRPASASPTKTAHAETTNGARASHTDEPAGPAEDTIPPAPSRMVPRYNTAALFEALPDQRWAVSELQIGPGRPTLIAGYGASAKTISVQSLALSLAAGRPIWDHFESPSPLVVVHIDYEQTYFATAKRYQRLALGMGIELADLGGRLSYIEMPRVYLDQKGAEDEYLRVCDGADLVIVDALRGAAPHTDENDSSFRASIDALTYCSQRSGASLVVLHHAGKPKKDSGDARTVARGSSAIFDASGCVFNFVAKPGESGKLVQQVKTPAEAEGSALDAFELHVEDVAIDGVAKAGVRVSWRKPQPVDESAKAAELFERDAILVMKAVRRAPEGQSANAVVARCGVHRNRALDVLKALADEGRLEIVAGPRRSKLYRLPTGGDK